MSYPISLGIQGLLAKAESVYGTDPVPVAGTDGVRCVGYLWEAGSPEFAFPNLRDDVFTGTRFPQTPGTPAGKMMSVEFSVELRGAGAAYSSSVKPEIAPLLTASGFAETLDATGGSETYTYDLADTGLGSATLYVYAGGKLHKLLGCRGTMSWDITAGGLGRMKFQMQGVLAEDPTEVALPDITYDSTQSPAAVNMGLSIDPGTAWTPAFATATLDVANEVIRLDDANAADAIEGFDLPTCKPTFKVQARAVALTTYNPYGARSAATSHTIDAVLGSVQYNKVSIDINDAVLANYPASENYQNLAAWGLTYNLNDLALVFS